MTGFVEQQRQAALTSELLDVIEFCEGALLDHFSAEDGLDVEAARAIAKMCSDVLVKHDRVSAMVESSKMPET